MVHILQQSLDQAMKQKIYEGFSRHAIASTGFDGKTDPIAFVAHENGSFVGAVVVEVFWGALHIKYVYVEEAWRGHGIATQLMHAALEFGRNHKCPFAFVETMSFQALKFYQNMGFSLEFTRPGYAMGTSFHYLKKIL